MMKLDGGFYGGLLEFSGYYLVYLSIFMTNFFCKRQVKPPHTNHSDVNHPLCV